MSFKLIKNQFALVAGAGEGNNPLTSFDAALLEAGIGNYNIIKMTSILPPGVTYTETIDLPEGAFVTMAYGSLTSSIKDEIISAAVAVGVPKENTYGIIVETSGFQSKDKSLSIVNDMIKETFQSRDELTLKDTISKGVEHKVNEKTTCVFSGVALF